VGCHSAHGGMPAPAARVLHFWIISGFTSLTIQWRRLCHGSANLGLDGWRSFHARVVLSLLTFPARGVWSFPNTQIPHVVAICPSPLSLHSGFFIITESNMFPTSGHVYIYIFFFQNELRHGLPFFAFGLPLNAPGTLQVHYILYMILDAICSSSVSSSHRPRRQF